MFIKDDKSRIFEVREERAERKFRASRINPKLVDRIVLVVSRFMNAQIHVAIRRESLESSNVFGDLKNGRGSAVGLRKMSCVGSRDLIGAIIRTEVAVLLIEQCWSFINSKLTRKAAKVLNGVICGIASIGDLKGRKIGYSVGGFEDALLKTMLATAGLTLADVELVNVNFALSQSLLSGAADAVAFGKLAIANPDLPQRFADGTPLTAWDAATFYSGGASGYTDYPARVAEPA